MREFFLLLLSPLLLCGNLSAEIPRYKCDGNKCVLLPAVSESLLVQTPEQIPPSQQPTLAEPQVVFAHSENPKPLRSVLVRPVRRVANIVQGVRAAKPVRRLLGRLLCRR